MESAPPNGSRTLFIPIKDSDEAVSIPAQDLPDDAEEEPAHSLP